MYERARTVISTKLTKHSHTPVGMSFRGFFRPKFLLPAHTFSHTHDIARTQTLSVSSPSR